jgi:hypothetical protein
MGDLLYQIEGLGFSTFVRESGSLWAFPMFLFVHTLGVSLVAGGGTILSFAILGLWPRASVRPLDRLYPFIWFGFAINLFTGLGLLMADASTKGVNPVFWIKMLFVICGVTLLTLMRRRVFRGDVASLDVPPSAKMLAWGCEDAGLGLARLLVRRHRVRPAHRLCRAGGRVVKYASAMACARCPYTSKYQLLWQHADDPDVIAVMLRCCAGPELQIRRGSQVLLSEIFPTSPAVVARAEELRGRFAAPAPEPTTQA